jgi:hypothetical protein
MSLIFVAATISVIAWRASPSFHIDVMLPRDRLPRDLLDFLNDAHQHNILWQTGTVYQFRHATLQQFPAQPRGSD